jgi:thiol-disulfide isomerase/thioredoxin
MASTTELESLDTASRWLNSSPLSADTLRGNVVLINFWTYTCINWLRTLPHVRAWDERYRDQGLTVIGVHSPEFGFEHDLNNVEQAAKQMRVEFPIVIDNDFRIWRSFDNHYWPALYFVDAHGRVRDSQFGEGDYPRAERVLQDLLKESGRVAATHDPVRVDARGIEAEADWAELESPETYLGYERAERFSSPGGLSGDTSVTYTEPARLRLNEWALAGDWTVGWQPATLNEPGGRIVYRFHARDLHLVMGPGSRGSSIPFRVLIDGEPPGEAHGLDIDEQGVGTLDEQRLYQLIRQRGRIEEHTFEIAFLDPGAQAFVFTFG